MSVRTISVTINGLNDIEAKTKLLNNMKATVLDIERMIKKMGRSDNLPSINLKLNIDTSDIQKQINNVNALVSKASGSSVGGSSKVKGQAIEVTNLAESWKNVGSAMDEANRALTSLTSNMIKLGAINPAKTMLSGLRSVSSELFNVQKSFTSMVNGKLTSGLQNIVGSTLTSMRQGVTGMVAESQKIGDAMQIYRVNMSALGFSDKDVNKSLKRLGNYGKSSVYDASDLIHQASTLYAYNRKDSEDVVKAFAGLIAQTNNPVEGLKTAGEQTAQMLANGYLNQQDFKFTRERFSALGASEVNKRLLALAQSKGYSSIIKATQEKAITADEYLDVIKEVGNSPKFQNLVTSILTPKQAIDNLKETLSNLLVFDKVDDDGNSSPGALNKVYVATRDFIKSVTDVVGSEKFEGYVRKLGDAIGTGIENINKFSHSISLLFGSSLVRSLDTFGKNFASSLNGSILENTKGLFNSVISFFNETGSAIGKFVNEAGNSYIRYLTSWVNIGKELVNGGILDAITSVINLMTNLQELAVNSGAVKDLAGFLKDFSNELAKLSINDDVKGGAKSIVKSIKGFADEFINAIHFLATSTPIVQVASKVVSSIFDFFTNFVKLTRQNLSNNKNLSGGLKAIGQVISDLLEYLAPVLARITSSAINALTSNVGVRFFQSLSNFVKAVVTAIENVIKSFGGGNLQKGFENILGTLTTVVEVFAKLAEILGHVGKYLIIGALIGKATSLVSNIVSFIGNTVNSLGQLNNFSLPAKTKAGMAGSSAQGATSLLEGGGFFSGFFNKRAEKYYSKRSERAYLANDTEKGNYYADLAFQARQNRNSNKGIRATFNDSVQAYKNVRANGGTFRQAIGAGFDTAGGLGQSLKGAGLAFGTMFGGMAIDGINNFVQGSKMSNFAKQTSNVISSTASGALAGAGIGSMFSPIGTALGAGIGGFIGLVQGLFTNNADEQAKKEQAKFEAEAKKQKEEIEKAETEAQIAQLRESANRHIQLMSSFYRSLKGEQGGSSDLATSSALVSATASEFGGDANKAGSSLGLASVSLPKDIDKYSVSVNGDTKTWAEWRDQLGVDDASLLKSLQQLYASYGQKYIELKNSTDGTVTQIQTLSDAEGIRRQTNVGNFIGSLQKVLDKTKIIPDQAIKLSFEQISQFKDDIDFALKAGNFGSKEDQKQALVDAVSKLGVSKEKLQNLSIQDLTDMAKTLDDSASLNGNDIKGTNDYLASKLEKLKSKVSGKVKDFIDNLLKDEKEGNVTTDDLQAGLSVASQANQVSDDSLKLTLSNLKNVAKKKASELTSTYINAGLDILESPDFSKSQKETAHDNLTKELQDILGTTDKRITDKILEYATDHKVSLESAIEAVSKDYKVSDEEKAQLQAELSNFTNLIGKMYQDGTLKLSQVKDLLANVNMDNIDTSKISAEGLALLQALGFTIDKTTNKVKEVKDQVNSHDPGTPDTSKISQAGTEIDGALRALVNSVANFMAGIYVPIPKSVGGGKGEGKGVKRQFGGIIPEYHSDGDIIGVDWTPRGTDTVPTMLTPGEYVLRKKAVESLGLNFLNNLNSYGNKALQSSSGQTIINNVYNTNNAKISQNIDNKSQYLNGLFGIDRLMRYV